MNIFENTTSFFIFIYNWLRRIQKRVISTEHDVSLLSDKIEAMELSCQQDVPYHTHNLIDINDLQNILSGKADVDHDHIIQDITNLEQILEEKVNKSELEEINSSISSITEDVSSLQIQIDSKADENHTHEIIEVNGLRDELIVLSESITELSEELENKAPIVHGHLISNIVGLQTTLNSKAEVIHSHTTEEIDDFEEAMNLKADVLHDHDISDITNLQTVLDDKASVNHSHIISDVSNLQNVLDDKSQIGHTHVISDTDNLQGTLNSKAPIDHTHVGLFSFIGQVLISQTAVVAISLGIRDVTTSLASTSIGEKYQAFCRSYRLSSSGSFTAGKPLGYAIVDCACNSNGQITVSLNAPLLGIGSTYQLNVDIFKLNN